MKTPRTYTNAKRDLLEASLRHLEDAAGMYDLLSQEIPWVTIECFDKRKNAMRAPEEIAKDVSAAVQPVLFAAMAGKPAGGNR